MNENEPDNLAAYELRNEYDLATMTVVLKGRRAPQRQAANEEVPLAGEVTRIVSPCLRDPKQASDFVMEVKEEPGDAAG